MPACDDGFDNFDWQDIALAGALAEQMAEEQKELERLKCELTPEEEDDDDD